MSMLDRVSLPNFGTIVVLLLTFAMWRGTWFLVLRNYLAGGRVSPFPSRKGGLAATRRPSHRTCRCSLVLPTIPDMPKCRGGRVLWASGSEGGPAAWIMDRALSA